jgi:hypothetical protein
LNGLYDNINKDCNQIMLSTMSVQQPFTVTLDGLIHGVGRQVNITRPGDKPIGYLKALQKIGGVLSVIPDLVEGKSKGETKTGRTEKARPTIRHPAIS